MKNDTSRNNLFTSLVFLSILLTLMTVILSAHIRLSTNGLGCTPWPQCYGHVGETTEYNATSSFTDAQPDRPHGLARMLHRLVASVLGLFVVMIVVMAMRMRKHGGPGLALPVAILAITVFLSVLGYSTPSPWIPAVTVGNLVGGMIMLAMLWWLGQRYVNEPRPLQPAAINMIPRAKVALILLCGQIVLGAWVSGNLAVLTCSDNLFCNGNWIEALNPARQLEIQQGRIVIDNAMPAINTLHRIGALVTTIYLLWFGIMLQSSDRQLKLAAMVILVLVLLQVLAGISVVFFTFPLGLATLHNAIAAILLLSVTNITLVLTRK